MRNRYSIGFFASVLILALSVTCAYQISTRRTREKAQARAEAEREAELARQKTVSASGHAMKEDCYYLMEVNGYVVVYLSDRETAYEYTDIRCDGLPEELRKEIMNGKYVKSQEELYGFLENYSS